MSANDRSMRSEIKVTVRPATWRDLLHDLNKIVLNNTEIVARLPANLVELGWLGRPKARANVVAAAERRLGKPLPPSYREFLAESNGWQCLDWTHLALLPAGQVGWLRDLDPSLVKIWNDLDTSSWGPAPSDSQYAAAYRECHGIERFRPEHLQDMLVLSDRGWTNADYVWLNPHAIFPNGEWEAWTFVPGEGSGSHYRSFWDLMVSNLRSQIHDRCFP